MLALTTAQVNLFVSDACFAIEKSHNDAWADIKSKAVPRPQWEPRFVAFFCAAMRDVANAWRSRIRAINPRLMLSVSTVFTHQSPYVRWASGRCELADLLVAFVDKTSTPASAYAVLVQAKQGDVNPLKLLSKSEKDQFHLLSKRPKFSVDASSAPTNVLLPTSKSGNDKALLYGVNPPKSLTANPPPWSRDRWKTDGDLATAPVPNQVSPGVCLAETLVEQIQGNKVGTFPCRLRQLPAGLFSRATLGMSGRC
jgi:hypothetical protein